MGMEHESSRSRKIGGRGLAPRDRIAARAQEIKGLQSLRKAAVRTQAEIAKTLGVSQPSVAKIERQADMY
jgi:transcriptional regulator